MITVSIGAISSAHSRRKAAGIPSAPHAFFGLSFLSRAQTPGTATVISGIGGNGDGPRSGGADGSSVVKTDANWALSISAFSVGSTAVLLFVWSVPTLLELFFLFFM